MIPTVEECCDRLSDLVAAVEEFGLALRHRWTPDERKAWERLSSAMTRAESVVERRGVRK